MSTLSWSADLVDLCFAALSIYGAHSFYQSSRKRWQTVLAWTFALMFCAACGEVSDALLTGVSHERAQMFIGLSGVFVYLYLFNTVPIAQRMFTYFLVDSSVYLLVLLARTLSLPAVSVFGASADWSFLLCFFVCAAFYLWLLREKARQRVLAALPAFRHSFGGLTMFSGCSYLAILLLVDAWGPMPLDQFPVYIKHLSLILAVGAGYYMAFHTLVIARESDEADQNALILRNQLALNEKYYDGLLASIQESRIRNHDLRHHVNALNALCAEKRFDALAEYAKGMAEDLPAALPVAYCGDVSVNALLNHYSELCRAKGIPFSCKIRIPRVCDIKPLHLCVVFGNVLENALEASLRLKPEAMPFISCKAAYDQNKLAVTVENRFDGKPLEPAPGGGYASSKAEGEHGLGIRSVHEVVRRYRGWCGTEIQGDIFILKLMLNVEENGMS